MTNAEINKLGNRGHGETGGEGGGGGEERRILKKDSGEIRHNTRYQCIRGKREGKKKEKKKRRRYHHCGFPLLSIRLAKEEGKMSPDNLVSLRPQTRSMILVS